MENPETESCGSEDTSQLSRNRSFKSKQLVRSQAIRESQSPPRIASPACDVTNLAVLNVGSGNVARDTKDDSSHSDSGDCSKQQVEIQITSGAWEEGQWDHRARTRRWIGSRDLLSEDPRVTCVCGACNNCQHCRGRRRRPTRPTKQDSGIVCPDDCGDGSDSEQNAGSNDMEEQISYCRCPERKEKLKSMSFSRTDSEEFKEPSGPDLVNFIKETLNKNARDRMTLLKIERELQTLVADTSRILVKFPIMSSYGRMLVHRCASLFQLSHNLDVQNKNSVQVSKIGTSGGRIPCTSFKVWCTTTFPPHSPQRHQDLTNAKSILKRDTHSLDEPGGASIASRSKSLEQREREYERVRRRIFSEDNCLQDDSQWPWLSGPVKLLTPDGRNKLLKVHSLESPRGPPCRLGPVAKSHSFGGMAEPRRLLSTQGDLASSSWRLSPSSSGYRTLSLHSADSVTPSPTGEASPEPQPPPAPSAPAPAPSAPSSTASVVWCVSDVASVPRGATIIHPQTGLPLTNADGTVYHYDPTNPPSVIEQNQIDQYNEKRRGRLEKQRSFIDTECECPAEQSRKCFCDCQRQDVCQPAVTDTIPDVPEQKTNQKPASPCKVRYEHKGGTQSNHSSPPVAPTNHRPPYNAPANHRPASEKSTNQRNYVTQANFVAPNQKPYDYRQYELSNQRQDQRVFDVQRAPSYDAANQRRHGEAATNHRPGKVTNQESPETQYIGQQVYPHFRNEDVTSPPQVIQNFVQPELPAVQAMVQAKITPLMPDPNIRPLSLTNMYPLPQGYQYINPCRMDQQLQPALYQPLVQPVEDHKIAASPHDTTFRIDPSYPYPPIDYAAHYDPNIQQHHHRGYTMGYAPNVGEASPAAMSTYPMANVLLQQPHQYPYTYVQELYPLMQYPMYPHCPVPSAVYHPLQMVPQPIPVCPAPLLDAPERSHTVPHAHTHTPAYAHVTSANRNSKRNSFSGSSRVTPSQTPESNAQYEDNQTIKQLRDYKTKEMTTKEFHNRHTKEADRQSTNEIAVKIQQIKEQMAVLGASERQDRPKREEWKGRNSGNGILGSYPVNNYNGRVAYNGKPTNDESQLTTAARAIVNSIRSMKASSTYQSQDPRRPDSRPDKPDYRRYNSQGQDRQNERKGFNPQHRPYCPRQMSPGTWCRRSPVPIQPTMNQPRRPPPDNRNAYK